MVRAKKGGGRGGARQGTPGQSYTNRSDLTQAPRAVPGQTYGQAGAQIAAQQAVPLPQQAPPTRSAPTPLDAPTAQPNVPLTAGIPTGLGPGPEALPMQPTPIDEIRAMYAAYPNDDMRRLLSYLDTSP